MPLSSVPNDGGVMPYKMAAEVGLVAVFVSTFRAVPMLGCWLVTRASVGRGIVIATGEL